MRDWSSRRNDVTPSICPKIDINTPAHTPEQSRAEQSRAEQSRTKAARHLSDSVWNARLLEEARKVVKYRDFSIKVHALDHFRDAVCTKRTRAR
jgi:hypothetical protein